MVVLSWLQKKICQLKTFVANRVATTEAIAAVYHCRHVPSINNSADLINRGLDLSKLFKDELWYTSPGFLSLTGIQFYLYCFTAIVKIKK